MSLTYINYNYINARNNRASRFIQSIYKYFFSLTFIFIINCLLSIYIYPVTPLTILGTAEARSLKKTSPYAQYRAAWKSYKRLSRSARLRKSRKVWLKTINAFRKVYLTWPDNEKYAAKSLYMMARIYRELYGYSGKKADLKEAIERYEVLFERFPNSPYADDALYYAGSLYYRLGEKEKARLYWERIVLNYEGSDFYKNAVRRLGKRRVKRLKKRKQENKTYSTAQEEGQPLVRDIRHWSEKDYTRVVIDISRAVPYHEGYLPANKKKGLPKRLYIDVAPAKVAKDLEKKIVISDGLLKRVRVAQFDRDTARIVFDLGKTSRTRVFNLDEPFRIVVDAFGEKYSENKYKERPLCPPPSGKKLTLAQQLGLCVRRIVVDAGHGGKDPGAIGPTSLKEKEVALKVAKLLKKELEKRIGAEVILTRSTDKFLPLEQRTAIANAKKADLFISIHCNAAPSRRLSGIETYFLNFALDEEAMRVAALENAMSEKRMGELKGILNKIMKNTKVAESKRLGQYIQKGLVKTLRKKYSKINDLGVKQAPFFVLIGARMPSVLTEISFISNRREERRLRSRRYLETIAKGIAEGVDAYIKNTELISRRSR